MSPRPGFVAVRLSAGLLLISCAAPRSGLPPGPPKCPGFVIAASQITVTPAGGTFQLGGGNRIEFASGAVSSNTQFSVSALTVNNEKVAGVRIEPATGPFPEPVRLRLSYAGCPEIEGNSDKELYIVVVGSGGGLTSIGGAKSVQGKFVEAFIPHFTDFAIAL